MSMNINKEYFGVTKNGEEVYRYSLKNENGMQVSILNFGGAIQRLMVPDKLDRFTDVVGGYDDLYDYEEGDGYQGALIGRYGNRIANATFDLDGKTYQLYQNNGKNHLHGGKTGFSHRIWQVAEKDGAEPSLTLHLLSEDGDEGYPGALDVCVTYTLTADNALSIHYVATTDKTTILNLTNHTYFNLGGYASGTVKDHLLCMDADAYLPVDEELIPTGEIRAVENTPFDFRTAKTIGQDIDCAGGYDHCLCFTDGEPKDKEVVDRIYVCDPVSGREMVVATNQPCVQFYSANFLKNPDHPFKGGYPQAPQNAFCLETQHMPDSIHQPHFTDVTLKPGQVYDYMTVYRFSVKQD